jgi:predicted DNA-binding transcriptional regulator AlpA
MTTTTANTTAKIAAAKAAARKKKASASPRLLSRKEVLDKVPVSYVTLWSWMRDGKFPRSHGNGVKTFWHESEVDAWINDLPVTKLKGDEAA